MKFQRRLLNAILLMALVFSLCSCGANPENEDRNTESAGNEDNYVSENTEVSNTETTSEQDTEVADTENEKDTESSSSEQESVVQKPTDDKNTETQKPAEDNSEPEVEHSPQVQAAIDAGYYNVAPFVSDEGNTGYTVMVHLSEGRISNLAVVLMEDFLAEKGLKVSFTIGGELTNNGEDMWFCLAFSSKISEMTETEKASYESKRNQFEYKNSYYHYTAEDGTVYYQDMGNNKIFYMDKWSLSNGKAVIVKVIPEWQKDGNGNAYYVNAKGATVYPGFAYPFDNGEVGIIPGFEEPISFTP